MKQFDITYFCGPYSEYIVKPEIVADIASAGITLVPLGYSTDVNKKALVLLNQFGLRANVADARVYEVYSQNDFARVDETVKQVVEDYAEYSNIAGWEIIDEPHSSKFPILSAIVRAFRRYSPGRETVINLFPNYASEEQLGNPDYMSHLEMFVNVTEPHFLSYDHYHFMGRENRTKLNLENIDERERLIRVSAETTENRKEFFENMEDVRHVALKYGLDAMMICLLVEHGPYRNLTYGELAWEVNMCLAYGMRRISYFTYWQPSDCDPDWRWDNAMCTVKGERYQHWYDVQKLNGTISDVGNWLFDKTSVAVYHIGIPESGTRAFEPFGGVKGIEGENGVVGFFDDGSVYLVNRNFQRESTFKIHADHPMTVRREGAFVLLTDGKDCAITLAPGEAVLLHL